VVPEAPGFMPWTFFHTVYGMPSGPGAEDREDLLSAWLISSLVRRSAEGSGDRRHLGGRGSFSVLQSSPLRVILAAGNR